MARRDDTRRVIGIGDGSTPRVTLSEEIAERLVSSILAGRYAFGERMPPERELARILDVGRPTIREALRILRVIGLVEIRSGEGAFVVNHHSDFVAKAFGWTMLLDPPTAREVVEVRVAIETELARLAAVRATADDVARLHQLVARMGQNLEHPSEFTAADVAFHLTIARAANNLALQRLLEAIQSLLRQWMQRALRHSHTSIDAEAQHQAIIAGIDAHDPDRAGEAMRSHILAMGAVLSENASVEEREQISEDAPALGLGERELAP